MNSQPKKKNNALLILLAVFVLPIAVAKLVLSFDLYNGGATNKGILSKTRSTNELAEDISNLTKEDVKELEKLSYDELMNRVLELNKKLPIPDKIETRGTAQIWKENSDYYPFYRKMADETANGPRIASGSLPNNPLDIKLTG